MYKSRKFFTTKRKLTLWLMKNWTIELILSWNAFVRGKMKICDIGTHAIIPPPSQPPVFQYILAFKGAGISTSHKQKYYKLQFINVLYTHVSANHSCMPSPLAPDLIRVQSCVCCLFWTNRNCLAVTSIFLSISLSNQNY